ncbi:TetR/AcrR family transcriptional regulator [Streptomyces sp. NPDC004286]|uniref:TetR/AcrR family transcriptional regulator n=1 Tax=Streptomyces sp. NPDC004286 TaxID=3364696 RepID=UPI0036AABA3F
MATTTAAQSPRKRMRHADRREQLLDVAEQLFIAEGFSAVTMEDIARAGGVTRPVVYNHFETREGAYLAVVRRAREKYDAVITDQTDLPSDLRARLKRGAETFFSMLENDPERWKLLFGSSAVLPPAYAEELSALRFGTIQAIEENLRAAVPQLEPRLLEAMAHSISGVGERLGHWRLADPSVTIAELVEYYTDILWSGIGRLIED